MHLVDAELFKRYGPVVRVGPNRLIFSEPAAYRAIHGFHRNIERGDFYAMARFADQGERSVFSSEANDLHREKRRKLVSVAMTPQAFAAYEPYIGKTCERWVNVIAELVSHQGPRVDIALSVKALLFDSLFEMLVGERMGCLNILSEERFKHAIAVKEKTSKDGFGFGLLPWFPKLLSSVPYIRRRFRSQRYDESGRPLGRTLLFWVRVHTFGYKCRRV